MVTTRDPALEVGANLKRTFAQYRLYGVRHESAEQAERELHSILGEVETDLLVRVEATRLLVEGRPIVVDDRKDESITRPLFSDGVEAICFHTGLELQDLRSYLHVWNGAITRTLDVEHTFSTLVWEMENEHISTMFRPGLAESGVADRTAKEQGGRTSALLDRVLGDAPLDQPVKVEVDALSVLGDVSAFAELDQAELVRVAQRPQDAIDGLSPTERAALASGLSAARRGVGQRTLFGLWRAIEGAHPAQRAGLSEFAVRVVTTLIGDGRAAEAVRALVRIVEEDPAFAKILATEEVVSAAVEMVADPGSADDAVAIIRYLPAASAALLIKPLTQAPRDVRARLALAIAAKRPAPARLAAWALQHSAATADALFVVAERLSPEHRDFLTRACLISDEAPVRARGLSAIQTENVPLFRTLILDLLQDDAQETRQSALQALVRAKDQAATAILERQLLDEASSLDVKRTCIRGLATVGGPHASQILCRVVAEGESRELKKAAALGLASAPSPEAIDLLRSEAGRLLGDRQLKEACREALRRIEARS